MSILNCFSHLESSSFRAAVNVASSESVAISIITNDSHWQELLQRCSKTPQLQGLVLHRLKLLSSKGIDPRFENPSDVAIAAYTWLLSTFNPAMGEVGANIAGMAPQCWWARKVATLIFDERPSANAAASVFRLVRTPKQSPDPGWEISTAQPKIQNLVFRGVPLQFSNANLPAAYESSAGDSQNVGTPARLPGVEFATAGTA